MARTIVVILLVGFWPGSIRAQNLLVNPDFDGDLAGWSTLNGSFSFNAEDADGGVPGSAEGASPAEFGAFLGQCVSVEGLATYDVGGMFRRIMGAAATADWLIVSHASVDCSGGTLDSASLSGPLGGAWGLFEDSFVTPAGASSANVFVGIEGGNSTFRMDDLFVVPEPFNDGFISGDTTAWSSDAANVGCAHNYCNLGPPLTAGCDDCVTAICAADSFCCDTDWDDLCVGMVTSICFETCSLTNCEHDVCQEGGALTETCDPCTSAVCAADSFCCTDDWDSLCVEAVETNCGVGCSYSTCDHSICLEGGPLDVACDSCVADICAADSFCCAVAWDDQCTAAVATVCGGSCT